MAAGVFVGVGTRFACYPIDPDPSHSDTCPDASRLPYPAPHDNASRPRHRRSPAPPDSFPSRSSSTSASSRGAGRAAQSGTDRRAARSLESRTAGCASERSVEAEERSALGDRGTRHRRLRGRLRPRLVCSERPFLTVRSVQTSRRPEFRATASCGCNLPGGTDRRPRGYRTPAMTGANPGKWRSTPGTWSKRTGPGNTSVRPRSRAPAGR